MGRKLGLMFALFCVGTVLTQGMLLAYWAATGQIDKDKIGRMIAVAQGTESNPAATAAATDGKNDKGPTEPSSFDELDQLRSLKLRLVDLREENLKGGIVLMGGIKAHVDNERTWYSSIYANFYEELKKLREGAIREGRDRIREILEADSPKLAKDQIMQIIADNKIDDVVAILPAIPTSKRAKIISAFTSEEERAKLQTVLRMILEGYPDTTLVAKTKQDLEQFKNDNK
jgi:hypothetical protein